jgi:ORF6N domain-containing protein
MNKSTVAVREIAESIQMFRGQKVLLDFDLAELYGVTTGNLNKAVKRNAARFPNDFMFQLKSGEAANLMFQIGISRWGGRRRLPYAFTEQGVAMLSSVLRSERAVKVNIAIMRAFVRLRETLEVNRALAQQFTELEKRVSQHDDEITAIIDAIRQLMAPAKKSEREIGFHVQEKPPRYGARKR